MDPYDEPNDDEYDYESYAIRQRQPHGGSTLMMTTQVTTKVPPGFDGKTSWFAFEDAIDDRCDITELEQEKWGPALRNRLVGEAAVYKRLLDRDELRQPNGRGVLYFKKNTETKGVKVGQPIDHKHGSNLNTAYGQAEAWKKIKKMNPELIFINNPSPQSARKMIFRFCLEVIIWLCKRKKKFIVTCPEQSYFAQFLDQKRWHKVLNSHLCWEPVDIQHFCNCHGNIKDLKVYHSYDEYSHDVSWFEYLTKNVYFKRESLWNDPDWKYLPSRFIAALMQGFPELSRSYVTDGRQEFLLEDVLEDFDNGLLCGTCMHHDRHGDHSLLLRDVDTRNADIPVPLRHILPQKFWTPSLVSTLRMIDSLPVGTEVSVRESTNEKIVELIPGLQNIRQKTLPQMYFEACSVFRGTYGPVNPLFSHQEDAVMILWMPGEYGKIYFMFMSQLYAHYKEFHVHNWSMIVFSTETAGAIRRRVENPPVTGGQIPPHAPVEVDGHDPIHPDDRGPPLHDDVDFPNEDVDDSGEQDDDEGMNDPPTDPPSGGQPPAFPPYPPPSNPPALNVPLQPQPQFDNPDEAVEQVMQPVADEDSSSEDRTLTEPIRLNMKQRHASHDSDDKPPKAKAKVQVKKQKVQLPGHQQPIVPPTVKPPEYMKMMKHIRQLLVQMIRLFLCRQRHLILLHHHRRFLMMSPIMIMIHLNLEVKRPFSTMIRKMKQSKPVLRKKLNIFNRKTQILLGEYFVLLGHKSAATDVKSYDVKGFQKFCQYFAKNGKKTPKSEAVIAPAILQQYAKLIKQAKLEEFRRFLDLKTVFLQGETYDLERRVIHVQLPSDIGLPPYLVGLCTRSVYGLADALRRWWNRLDKFLVPGL